MTNISPIRYATRIILCTRALHPSWPFKLISTYSLLKKGANLLQSQI